MLQNKNGSSSSSSSSNSKLDMNDVTQSYYLATCSAVMTPSCESKTTVTMHASWSTGIGHPDWCQSPKFIDTDIATAV